MKIMRQMGVNQKETRPSSIVCSSDKIWEEKVNLLANV